MMSSTEIRVPLITGLPIKTFGSPAIRSRHSIAALSENAILSLHSAYTIIGGPAIDITTPAF
jgi:hypothetical protein